jgi:[acyl-carrier-protein] S-malonyltransferase
MGTRTALVFSGQGSQAVGMGKDLFETSPECRSLFEKADALLGFSLSKICFEGPEEELKKTPNTQPALLVVSMAALTLLKKDGQAIDAVAGHSLGAYSALVAAGVLSFEDGVRLVRRRGELMEEAGRNKGTMAVILNLEESKVDQACKESAHLGVVEPANVNCPGQIVISGERNAVLAACEKAKALGAKRAMELPVSGPFHCSLMGQAAETFKKTIDTYEFHKPLITYYSDIDGVPMDDPESIKDSLVRQLVSPVQWIKVIDRLAQDGIGKFIEVGAGKVLSGLIRKIKADIPVLNAGDMASITALKGGS